MIDKKEDNDTSIKFCGMHESVSTISLENVDQYLKQLEAQKLEARSNISSSFMELSAFLVAREKQLLRQVDVMHDHLILCLQSRPSLLSKNCNCCSGGGENAIELTERRMSSSESCKTKVSPGIEVSLDVEELQRQIRMVGKVEVTGSSFMHLSEDNETFDFPYRVQSYQESCKDHMLLYKPLDGAKTGSSTTSITDRSDVESLLIKDEKDSESTVSPALEMEPNSNSTLLSTSKSSLVIFKKSDSRNGNMDTHSTLEEDNKHIDKKELGKTKEGVRRPSEEKPEDVRYWMQEILYETNPEPSISESDTERFDLFAVLKCSFNEECLDRRPEENLDFNNSFSLASLNLLQQEDQENLLAGAESNERFLGD